ncbi:hypothetical protein DPMN_070679 [Dreissena polymorpha]|uniref:Uncharacterized protein n=1 Tax=Dreissena polymorpha TaxID=45954 RepID=A0A9D3Z1S5_DREPO|nr:hypothetical protein DPMN_070679 [Dreissena polymorpha]
MSRIAACLGRQMRSFAAKCDLPPHTDAASTTDVASTRFALLPGIAKYVCSALAVLYYDMLIVCLYIFINRETLETRAGRQWFITKPPGVLTGRLVQRRRLVNQVTFVARVDS